MHVIVRLKGMHSPETVAKVTLVWDLSGFDFGFAVNVLYR